jgi:hypothetical protein
MNWLGRGQMAFKCSKCRVRPFGDLPRAYGRSGADIVLALLEVAPDRQGFGLFGTRLRAAGFNVNQSGRTSLLNLQFLLSGSGPCAYMEMV